MSLGRGDEPFVVCVATWHLRCSDACDTDRHGVQKSACSFVDHARESLTTLRDTVDAGRG